MKAKEIAQTFGAMGGWSLLISVLIAITLVLRISTYVDHRDMVSIGIMATILVGNLAIGFFELGRWLQGKR